MRAGKSGRPTALGQLDYFDNPDVLPDGQGQNITGRYFLANPLDMRAILARMAPFYDCACTAARSCETKIDQQTVYAH